MDSGATAIIKTILPKVPSLLQTAFWHSVGYSENSQKWDLKTELIVDFIRSFMNKSRPSSISKQQYLTTKDPGIKGRVWISKITLPVPEEDDVRTVLLDAIEALKTDGGETYTVPELKPIEVEWTGYRAGVDDSRPRPDLSEAQQYDRLMAEVTSEVTVLYFHGGAYFLCDPSTLRPTCKKLAKLTGGRCFNVRYRLAPQNPFPAALLDALIAYLSLLSPPPGSFHKPILAKSIIIAGDSAGGGLCMALLQLLLQIHRSSSSNPPTVRFNGRDIEVPIPAGVSSIAAWVDATRSMPSILTNARYDYLPPPTPVDLHTYFPHCEIWPTDPPRGDIYCDLSVLCHPLVSPLAAKDWTGTCPIRLIYGSEMLVDEGKALAQRLAQHGGKVIWEEYEAMPHCFAMLLVHLEGSKICFEGWAQWMKDVVGGKAMETKGAYIEAKTYRRVEVQVERLGVLNEGEVAERMGEARRKRERGEEGETKLLPKL